MSDNLKVGRKKRLQGIVVSDKMQKTVVVKVISTKRHLKYHKKYTTAKRYKAHDQDDAYHSGDVVEIEETAPISKEKTWKVVAKLK